MINWLLVCSHKNQGGLGVCTLRDFNLALLAKWWWKFFHDTHALWVALISYNYYRRRRVHDSKSSLFGHLSSFWRRVLKVSTVFAFGIKIEAGDGCTTRFCLDIG